MNQTEKREKLRDALIDAAEENIRKNGLGALRARDLTKAAGCALGTLYNVFEDLDMLTLAVNSRTLKRLGTTLTNAAQQASAPQAQLQALGRAYMHFAYDNPRLWAALFDHQMQEGREIPRWHLEEHEQLISRIVGPLARLAPQANPDQLALRARMVFSAVHGVVKLSAEERFVALSPDALAPELETLIKALADQQITPPSPPQTE